jgi:hypothetical protein
VGASVVGNLEPAAGERGTTRAGGSRGWARKEQAASGQTEDGGWGKTKRGRDRTQRQGELTARLASSLGNGSGSGSGSGRGSGLAGGVAGLG